MTIRASTPMDAANVDPACGSLSSESEERELADVVSGAVERARAAFERWSRESIDTRLKWIRRFRSAIGDNPRRLADSVARERVSVTLAAEVLPLADACRFLEANARSILQNRSIGPSGRPAWLWGTGLRVRREPFGVVLIIGPSNYPLMIPGIQTLQALTAGNVVLWKPGTGGTGPARAFVDLAVEQGCPREAIQILPELPQAASLAMASGVDKAVLTGSVAAGRSLGLVAARVGVPLIMELSGCDAVFALDDADPELVSDCLAFGLTLNHGRTCIAPRRVFASDALASQIIGCLRKRLPATYSSDIPARAAVLVDSAIRSGAQLLSGSVDHVDGRAVLSGVAVLDHVRPDMEIARDDPFAPVVSILRVQNDDQALEWSRACPLALGASVFGSPERCRRFADAIDAGVVVINDVIVATADPRVPFGGRRQSGFGTTRGAAGLEEMTQRKALITARRWFRPHLKPPTPADAAVLEHLVRLEHAAGSLQRIRALPGLFAAMWEQNRFLKPSGKKPS